MTLKKNTNRFQFLKKILLYLLLLVIGLIFVGPFIWMFSVSFMTSSQDVYTFPPSFIPKPPTISNFINAWTVVPYGRYMLNSIIILLIMLPSHIFVGALASYPLARMKFKGREFIFFAMIGTMFLPEEGRLVPLYLIVKNLGMDNSWWGVIMPGIAGGIAVFLMRQAFLVIPKEIEEAAIIDGCGHFRMWWKIMLPLTKPTIAAVGVFGFINIWEAFIWPLIILNDNHLYTLALGLNYLTGSFSNDIRTLTAGTVISLVPVIIFFLFTQRFFIQGLQGAVKE